MPLNSMLHYDMKKVMFLCTGNSCRSQMAEGFLRHLGKGLFEVHSAGLFPAGLHPRAVNVMKEAGIDISGQKSKQINEKFLRKMDVVITLCGNAEAYCPMTLPEIRRLHWPIDDPASGIGDEEKKMLEFRRCRDEIKKRIEKFIQDNPS